jgi:hypothetical protein
MIRRIALLSMLLCAFVLMMRTRRAREARSVAPAAGGVAVAATSADGSARAQHSAVARGGPPPDTWDLPAPSGSPAPKPMPSNAPSSLAPLDSASTTASPRRGPAITKARRAADALANGSDAEALRLYDELRAEGARTADATVGTSKSTSAPAYEQASRILRARIEESPVSAP